MHIVPIVEGHGDVDALPILIRRVCEHIGKADVEVGKPIRCPRDKITKAEELKRVMQLANLKLVLPGAIIILLDADSDCPAKVAPSLLSKARQFRSDRSISVVLAKTEYESWFLASLSSLSGKRGIRKDASSLGDPEAISGAKERLEQYMEEGRTYSETLDQPALTALFSLDEARSNSSSFDKFYREIEKLVL